jgi:excinuclease ABC subunit C
MVNGFQIDLIKQKIKNLGEESGCYLWKDKQDTVIYVGKALKLSDRVRSYLNPNISDIKTLSLQSEIHDLEWIITNTEHEALILEASLIKKYFPKFNIRLKDDKRYPFICVSLDEMFPMVYLTRKVKADGKKYFGPYTDVKATRDLLNLILKIFPIRKTPLKLPLKKPQKPCLNFHIKRCLGPCKGDVSKEEYGNVVNQVIKFLDGKKEDLVRELKKNMEEYSLKMMFERAAIYRDMISSIQILNKRQTVISSSEEDEDILAIAVRDDTAQMVVFEVREGRLEGKKSFALDGTLNSKNEDAFLSFIKLYYIENYNLPSVIRIPIRVSKEVEEIQSTLRITTKKKIFIKSSLQGKAKGIYNLALRNAELNLTERLLATKLKNQNEALKNLKELLKLEKEPSIIECYDISHFQGSEPVGSGVMFVDGNPYKNGYRHYTIKSYTGINDPGMMHEVIGRRLQRLLNQEESLPDLVVIDGGFTQLTRATEAAVSLEIDNLPMIGLAKKREEVYFPGEKNPYTFPIDSPGMRLLRQIRDEAHRFGITHHRKRRNKATLSGILDGIKDIGPKRKKLIYTFFSGKKKLKDTTLEELQSIPEISEAIAEKVYKELQNSKNK